MEAGGVLRFDQAVNAHLAALRVPPLVGMFRWVTALGAGPALTAASITASLFLWAHRRRGYILPLWVTFLGAQATTWSGKYLIARHRPEFIPGVTEVSPSFPSGHATASMALFGYLAYALARDLPGRRPRFEIGFWAVMLVLLIGFSRVFLSVHFTTDVLAGFMVGGFWLLVGLALREGDYPARRPLIAFARAESTICRFVSGGATRARTRALNGSSSAGGIRSNTAFMLLMAVLALQNSSKS